MAKEIFEKPRSVRTRNAKGEKAMNVYEIEVTMTVRKKFFVEGEDEETAISNLQESGIADDIQATVNDNYKEDYDATPLSPEEWTKKLHLGVALDVTNEN